MQRIVPHLWFDDRAVEAARFYCSLFDDAQFVETGVVEGTASGDTTQVSFRIADCEVMAIDAGPAFTLNPSASFMVNIDPARESDPNAMFDRLWAGLGTEGTVLMPDARYPFSARYGWVQDRFGLSWQLIVTDPAGEPRPTVMPALVFSGAQRGGAASAIAAWSEIFPGSQTGTVARYPDEDADAGGMLMFGEVELWQQWVIAYDSTIPQPFSFSPAFSFLVRCDDQAEIDRLWAALSREPAAEQCGWLVDGHGMWWQVVPAAFETLINSGSPAQRSAVVQSVLGMGKIELAELERVYDEAAS